jgi:hypothetical protein
MSSSHEDYYWTAGDDWQINAQLVNSDGDVFDLTLGTPVIKWSLISASGERVLSENDCEISIVDASNGLVSIHVPGTATEPLAEGRYTDQIRIVYDGITSTLSRGLNWITADAWAAAVMAASAQQKKASFH